MAEGAGGAERRCERACRGRPIGNLRGVGSRLAGSGPAMRPGRGCRLPAALRCLLPPACEGGEPALSLAAAQFSTVCVGRVHLSN